MKGDFKMKAVVLGTGGWGTALSQILCDNGHETCLWSHNPAKAEEMARTRENPLLKGVHLPESLRITGDLECLRGADLVVSAPPSFAVRDTAKKMAPYLTDKSVVVSVSKVLETDRSGLAAASENMITLYTCVMDQRDYRWCVKAVEIG